MATDYDTWHPEHDDVTVDLVINNLNRNVQKAKDTLAALVPIIASTRTCTCGHSLDNSIMTDSNFVPDETKQRLAPLLNRVWELEAF